jgi:hypothetical protein
MHLFLYCGFATKIWAKIFSWLNFDFSLPHSLISWLKIKKKGLVMIWTAVVWAMWKERNSVIF